MSFSKSKKEAMKHAGQGLMATGVAFGVGGAYSGEMLLIWPMAIFIFLGVFFYSSWWIQEKEESEKE